MYYKQQFANVLASKFNGVISEEEILFRIESPKQMNHGDLAFPCFELAKIKRKAPNKIAEEIASEIEDPLFEKVEAVGAYINVFLNKQKVSSQVIEKVLREKGEYGKLNLGNKGVVTIDMSSPNIAKPFSMGHLRSTVIGNALSLLLEKGDYKPVKINHLGDWGTQFGKLIVAYKRWGNEEKVKKDTIKELLKLYIIFHEQAEIDASLEDQGRLWFKKLESGDEEAIALWNWFKEESLIEFNRIYDLLGINFDSNDGEAFYNDKMNGMVEFLAEKKLLSNSDGAEVVDLSELNMPPCLIRKSDGATLYATRDLTAALYRQETYQFVQSLYVVGNEQSLHFQQLTEVLKKMGYNWANDMKHISFGMILKDGKKMSTRKGKLVLLEEVLTQAIDLAKQNIETKNPFMQNKESVAHAIGVGAVIFHDLKNHRNNDVEFSLEDMLRVEGETGPYVQYTYVRACSLLEKGEYTIKIDETVQLNDDQAWPIISKLMSFSQVIERALLTYDPSLIAKFTIDLAQAFNKYYGSVRVLQDDSHKYARLSLVYAVATVLQEGLRILGIEAPKEM
ncbi:arginine--tRNA ligase [Aquibacillus rhizosphaerae]|uniref:Arginine--tRNA ligase n=1 Tax=Aquibacillus rhizosphaerae TaxID=3051431 RepID=A0ABT7L2Q0_9BACI|nr:arginine--tRNA ligase [Aquibacillus sp. LR5S19]MDL4840129.1 arginine--tRNA ligase [Aquibacillus sp. LR5S19]